MTSHVLLGLSGIWTASTRPGTGTPIPPLGSLLSATQWLAAEEVGSEGVQLTRRWRLARWSDGSTHLWLSRRKRVGRGEASSGLRYDVVTRPGEPPPD